MMAKSIAFKLVVVVVVLLVVLVQLACCAKAATEGSADGGSSSVLESVTRKGRHGKHGQGHHGSHVGHHGLHVGHHGDHVGHHGGKVKRGTHKRHKSRGSISTEGLEPLGITATEGVPVPGVARESGSRAVSSVSSNEEFLRVYGSLGSNASISTTQASRGPCSPLSTAAVIKVFTELDVNKRKQFPPTSTVILVLQNNITITRGLLFDGNFSCTIFRPVNELLRLAVKSPSSTIPALRVWNTHNVLIVGIGFSISMYKTAPSCQGLPELRPNYVCPVIHVYKSYGIQIAKGFTFGRIDVIRCANSRLDNLVATSIDDYDRSPGVIRMATCGIGPKLIKSMNVISNNEVFGADHGIVLVQGTVGAQVSNNFVHDYGFAGIRCGADVHYVGDCMLNTISRNYVYSLPGKTLTGDSGGIYFCLHWFNPGNVVECNYVIGGDHCYYLDYASSGIQITGGVCQSNLDGVKVNNGKWNVIRNLFVVANQGFPGWCTCLTVLVDNCASRTGRYWEAMRLQYYNTPTINQNWPWFSSVCSEKSIGRVLCNPRRSVRATLTGGCSGFPSNNTLDLVVVDPKTPRAQGPNYFYCERYTRVPLYNTHISRNMTAAAVQFNSYATGDFGLRRTSPLLLRQPGFKSCPRATVGRQAVANAVYYGAWNIAKPSWFDEMVSFAGTHIHDSRFIVRS